MSHQVYTQNWLFWIGQCWCSMTLKILKGTIFVDKPSSWILLYDYIWLYGVIRWYCICMILDDNRSYWSSMMLDLWCVVLIFLVCMKDTWKTRTSWWLFYMILKQMDRSLQPELLAKMPSLYESLADALGNARASGEGILRAPQKAGLEVR